VWIILLFLTTDSARYKTAARTLFIVATIGLAVYLVFICISFMFVITGYDAVNLGSFQRYAGAGVLCLIIALVYVWMDSWESWKEKVRHPMMTFCLVLVVAIATISAPRLYYEVRDARAYDMEVDFRTTYGALFRDIDAETDQVFIVLQDAFRFDFPALVYYLAPMPLNDPSFAPYYWDDPPRPYTDIYNIKGDAQQWANDLVKGGYDYVYLSDINGYFAKRFGSLFEDQASIKSHTLFRVIPQGNNTIVLRWVSSSGSE